MLVLTRKLQEQITIGQEITITVLRVKGNSVRIGIEAPDHIRVVRGELPRHSAPRTRSSKSTTVQESNATQSQLNKTDAVHDVLLDEQSLATSLKPLVERIGRRRSVKTAEVLLDDTATEPLLAAH